MGKRADELEGESELLGLMRERWRYGVTLGQLDAVFDYGAVRPVKAPRLLEAMVAHGTVEQHGDLYFVKKTVLMEYHFTCAAGHEFSVMAGTSVSIKDDMPCPALGCTQDAWENLTTTGAAPAGAVDPGIVRGL